MESASVGVSFVVSANVGFNAGVNSSTYAINFLNYIEPILVSSL